MLRHAMVAIAGLILLGIPSASAQDLRPTGLQFLDDAAYQSIPYASRPLLGELPTRFSLADRFPPPGDQGSQASCVGWAVAYAFKTYQEGVERGWDITSSDHQFSPAFIYNQITVTPNCLGGTNFVEALNLLRRDGVAPLRVFPYREQECSRQPDQSVKQAARPYIIADWRRVNVQDETEVKSHIVSGFPALIGMLVDRAFMQVRGATPYDSSPASDASGHAMVVVGFDDAKSAFQVVNSWGSDWGDRGFGWISYRTFRRAVREAYVAQDVTISPSPSPEPIPAPTPQPAPAPSPVPGVVLGIPTTTHNVPVPSPNGAVPGMQIFVPGTVENAAGQSVQVVVKFNYLNGPALFANPQEFTFRDVGGLVATGTPPRAVGTNHENLGAQPISIPYYALNFAPSGGARTYNLSLVAVVYLGTRIAAQSQPVPFVLRW